ncbi:histidine--tRNA ligase [bacterium]|nr:histidine--tRNA ligase [bacterium]
MPKLNLQPLSGMPEWSPAANVTFAAWKRTLADVYTRHGFVPLETAAIERDEILAAKVGPATQKQIYRVIHGSTSQSLRFDLTVPLARYVAAHQSELTFPYRRALIDRSWRGERAQAGRFREFYQADADVIGRGSLDHTYDAQILAVAADALRALQLGRFQIQISHRGLLMGFLHSLHLLDEAAVIQLLDDAPKIGLSKLKSELQLLRLDTFEIRHLLQFANVTGDLATFSQAMLRLDIADQDFEAALQELAELDANLRALGLHPDEYQFNSGIIRGLDYYTGVVFETILTDHPQIGAICSGGRYDNLVSGFVSEKMPGVGCSIGLTRLFSQALALGLIAPSRASVADVVVLPLTDQHDRVAQLATQLRAAGAAVDVYWQPAALKKQLRYADATGAPWALLVGDDELAADRYTLKNMISGEQTSATVAQIAALVQTRE